MKINFTKNKRIFAVILIIIVGFFLRAYNFTDWLHFELDQARDALVVNAAVENGAGELPLLGPRAAGTMLRLGPAFYYFQYIGAKIFGNTPQGVAYPVLLFSVLSIPFFYLFMRRYFSWKLSAGMSLLFSTSLFLISYSRFAWNPNMIPFFLISSMYFLLRAVDKNDKRRGWWMCSLAIVFAILVQLHFLALVATSLIVMTFLLIKRPRIKWYFWAGAVGLFMFINIPMAINELKTEGGNAGQFFEAVFKKSDESSKTLAEKVFKNYVEHSMGYWIVISGSQKAEFFELEKRSGEIIPYDAKCDRYCREHLPEGILAVLFFTIGLLLLGLRLREEKEANRRDFLILSSLWLGATFLIFTPLSFDLSPRFFLTGVALPFIFLGLFLEILSKILRNKKDKPLFIVTLILVGMNLFFVLQFFSEMREAKNQSIVIGTDKILKQKTRITLQQQNEIVDYLEGFYQQNNFPLIYDAQSEFHRAFGYLMDKKDMPRNSIEMKKIYREANYFLIIRTQSDQAEYLAKYADKFKIIGKRDFGTLTVFYLKPREEVINGDIVDERDLKREVTNYSGNVKSQTKRYIWREIF